MVSHCLCPICCSADQEWLTPSRRRPMPGGDIVRCASCHYVYRSLRTYPWLPVDTAAAIPQPEAGAISDEQQARQLAIIEQSVGCGALLDVGCGDGSFLERACRHGWQVAGVGSNSAAHARPLLHDAPIHPNLREGVWPAGSFDAVTIWGGFERHPQPETLLRLAAYYCRLDGVLALQMQNVDSRRTHDDLAADSAQSIPLRLYSPVAVHRLFSRYGFRTERIAPATPPQDARITPEHQLIAVARYTP